MSYNKTTTIVPEPQREISTVLIVDDDAQICELLQHSLASSGYKIVVAHSGEEGMQQAEKYKPSVMICDWMMPGLDGLDVCRRIKDDSSLNLTYFILLTAWGSTDDRVQALDTGADDFIQKPPNIKELRARVRAGIRIHNLGTVLQRKQREIEFDLAQARDYLQSLLPKPLDSCVGPERIRLRLDWKFIPSTLLGGDVFNYQWIDDDTLAIYLLDVAGHGVGAALLSVSILNMLRSGSISSKTLLSPANVMSVMNNSFPMDKQNYLFFTMWYGVLNFSSRNLQFACAGHPPAILQRNGEAAELLKSRGIPVGMDPDYIYEEQSVLLDRSSVLTLFSDGIYETVNVADLCGSLSGWCTTVEEQPSITPPYSLNDNLEYMMERAIVCNQSKKFEDDVSLLQLAIEL